MRDSHPAALVQLEVLAKRRRALILYGHLHYQRRNIQSNFDMDDWRARSLRRRGAPNRAISKNDCAG